MQQLTRIFVTTCFGICFGVFAVGVSLGERAKQNNAELSCEPWEERDDYRHFLFGRIAYCRTRSNSISW